MTVNTPLHIYRMQIRQAERDFYGLKVLSGGRGVKILMFCDKVQLCHVHYKMHKSGPYPVEWAAHAPRYFGGYKSLTDLIHAAATCEDLPWKDCRAEVQKALLKKFVDELDSSTPIEFETILGFYLGELGTAKILASLRALIFQRANAALDRKNVNEYQDWMKDLEVLDPASQQIIER